MHAYLIMAHNNFYNLEKLLLLLDDKRNDLYVHIDRKVKNFEFAYYHKLVKKSRLIFTDRIKVTWGDYSQIECELLLMKAAACEKKYEYLHLLSGTDLPIRSQNAIHDFFLSI